MAFDDANDKRLNVYLDQWLKTAADGNVVFESAFHEHRLKFICRKCGATQACDRPKNENLLDYTVREFVNLHSHRPGHTRIDFEVKPGPMYKDVPFKPIEHPVGSAVIDISPAKQKIIENQIEKYKLVMEMKLLEQAEKIKELQEENQKNQAKANQAKVVSIASKPGKFVESSGGWPPPGWPPQPMDWWVPPNLNNSTGVLIPFPTQTPPVPEPPKPKALKPKTGRRFR